MEVDSEPELEQLYDVWLPSWCANRAWSIKWIVTLICQVFFVCFPPEFLPVSGPLTQWCASTLGATLLCSSWDGSWFGAYIQTWVCRLCQLGSYSQRLLEVGCVVVEFSWIGYKRMCIIRRILEAGLIRSNGIRIHDLWIVWRKRCHLSYRASVIIKCWKSGFFRGTCGSGAGVGSH